jgi:hypothetical protein
MHRGSVLRALLVFCCPPNVLLCPGGHLLQAARQSKRRNASVAATSCTAEWPKSTQRERAAGHRRAMCSRGEGKGSHRSLQDTPAAVSTPVLRSAPKTSCALLHAWYNHMLTTGASLVLVKRCWLYIVTCFCSLLLRRRAQMLSQMAGLHPALPRQRCSAQQRSCRWSQQQQRWSCRQACGSRWAGLGSYSAC